MSHSVGPAQHPVSLFLQEKLKTLHKEQVDPVTATHWLIEAGMRDKIEGRPGAYVRTLCRRGLITGAVKKGSKWTITIENQK